MARRYSLPFKTVVDAAIALQPWHWRIAGRDWVRIEHDAAIPNWDYLAELDFSRDLEVDGDRARESCDLGPNAALDLVVTLVSPASRLRTVVFSKPLPVGASAPSIAFRAPSASLSDSVRLETEIVLAGHPAPVGEFAPTQPGSRLFTEVSVFAIEGTRSRMPTEMASFASQLPWLNAPNAPWFVYCGVGDLHAPVMRELRVYLNADQPRYAEPAREADPLLIGLLRSDVAASVIGTALKDDEFVSGSSDYAEESLGQAAARLLGICFRFTQRSEVARIARDSPEHFVAVIRSALVSGDA